mmetsp:Transcript_16883/g.46660  ORF Transcript_16883/g.46660 Transcript_16883/m.46660 type:complete len:374 (-) Transcript_16883:312-1433(-)
MKLLNEPSLLLLTLGLTTEWSTAFQHQTPALSRSSQAFVNSELAASSNPLGVAFGKIFQPSSSSSSSSQTPSSFSSKRLCRARALVKSLVEEDKCFSTDEGAIAFGNVCAINVVYEDCFEPQPIVGKAAVTEYMLDKVAKRKGSGDTRIDRISDGDTACGFAWTWVTEKEEGLRGTTFVQLNSNGEIQYVREIPEPLFKPGDATKSLLEAITQDAEPRPKPDYKPKSPTIANELAKYLFIDVQGADVSEAMRFFDDSIVYRDFNYEEALRTKDEVQTFIEDFSFPGIEFRPDRFDDGIDSTCFTWDVCLDGQEDTIKGVSFYELDPESRKITYVRDVPESAMKPAPLGGLARNLRPGLGVFQGVPIGSRPGGK